MVRKLLSRLMIALVLSSAVMFGTIPTGQTQESFELGRADPREVVGQIADSLSSGHLDAIKPWLSSSVWQAILLNEDIFQAKVTEFGAIETIDIIARRQVATMSYFELRIKYFPATVPPGTLVADIGEKSYWLIGFNGESNKIDLISFRRGVPFTYSGFSETTYIGKPTELQVAAAIDAISAPETNDSQSVQIFFATTRERDGKSYSEKRNNSMNFGRAIVRVPEYHKMGTIERPQLIHDYILPFISYEEKLDLSKHFIINDITTLNQEDWNKTARSLSRDEALIFVHGFNTTFDEALYRAAQLTWDLQYKDKGIPVLFSWASWGGATEPVGYLRSYLYDRDSALIGGNAFLTLLHDLKETLGIKKINVVTHSMGNFMMLSALKIEAQKDHPIILDEWVMAAPDVDRDLFLQTIPDVKKLLSGMTLYASSADWALTASKVGARGVARAGEVTVDGPVVLSGVDTIDVTAVGEELFGINHDVFAAKRPLIDDIAGVLDGRRPPNARLKEIWPVPASPPPPRYWRFVP